MTMAVAEQTAREQMPQSPQQMQLGLSSLLGAVLVLFCLAFVLGGLPAIWEHLFRVAEDVAAGRTPVMKTATKTSSFKPAKLENGVTIQVPEFIPSGVRVRVNPNTGEYLDRAKD